MEFSSTCCECIQKSFKLPRKISGLLIMHKANPAVEIPSYDDNGLTGRLSGADKGVKVCRAIDQKSYAIRWQESPTIAPFGTKTVLFQHSLWEKTHAETESKIWATV
jgi:hypothetical protein